MKRVVVVGGGISGTSCAVKLAENNIPVTLIEKKSLLGGNSTNGLLSTWFGIKSPEIEDKFLRELIEASIQKNISKGIIPDISGASPFIFSFHPNNFSELLFEILKKKNVEIKLNCKVVDLNLNSKNIESLIYLENHLSKNIEADYFVDASGNANIVRLCKSEKISNNQIVYFKFKVCGVNKNELRQYLKSNSLSSNLNPDSLKNELLIFRGFSESARKWFASNPLLVRIDGFDIEEVLNTDEMLITMLAFKYNSDDIFQNSKNYSNAIKLLPKAIEFLKNELQGFSHCYLTSIAETFSFVQSEQISSKEVLTNADVLLGKKFDKSIGESLLPSQKNISFQVPFNSQLINGIENLIVTGRAILPNMAFYKNGNPILNSQLGSSAAKHILELKNEK